jgi:hypothetical protein
MAKHLFRRVGGVPSPRGVRVLFSAPGQLADDLIRDLLRAEPPDGGGDQL